MAVTFRSKTESIPASTGTSPTLSEPTGAASGDLLFAFYLTTNTGAPTLPASWISLYNGSDTATAWRVGYISRGGAAPSYAFTHTGNIYYETHVLCLQGAATVTFDAQSTTGSVVSSTTVGSNPTAVVAVAASALCVAGGFNFGISGAWTAPSGYVIRTLTTNGTDAVMATKSLVASGSEDPGVFTISAGANGNMWNGFAVTFTDVATGSPSAFGRGLNPGRTPLNLARFYMPVTKGFTPITAATTTVFRKTLSGLGSHTGGRQTHN